MPLKRSSPIVTLAHNNFFLRPFFKYSAWPEPELFASSYRAAHLFPITVAEGASIMPVPHRATDDHQRMPARTEELLFGVSVEERFNG